MMLFALSQPNHFHIQEIAEDTISAFRMAMVAMKWKFSTAMIWFSIPTLAPANWPRPAWWMNYVGMKMIGFFNFACRKNKM